MAEITDRFVLAPDVMIISPREVRSDVRATLECDDSDFILTRPHSRSSSRIVNAETAILLRLFHKPVTIVDATIALARATGNDPERTLEEVVGTLNPFMVSRWLVPIGSIQARGIDPLFRRGDYFQGYEILDCLQVLEDTDVYQVRVTGQLLGALKIVRPGASASLKRAIRQEAVVLRHLGGDPGPGLLAEGEHEEMPYLITTWCPGVPVTQVANEIRQTDGNDPGRKLALLCVSVVDAYARLHAQGVIHGDVYPKNILANVDNCVWLLDFGYARLLHANHSFSSHRRAVPDFYEPELARAILQGGKKPPPTPTGEQYSVAAVLYQLITGKPYVRFSAHKEPMLRQILECSPLSFAEQGQVSWPRMEAALARGLEKEPANRFADMAAFLGTMREVASDSGSHPRWRGNGRWKEEERDSLDHLIGDGAELALNPALPGASVAYGAAGIAYTLYAHACAQEDAGLLSAADAWAIRATSLIDREGAFTSGALGLSDHDIGPASLYFGRPGVHLVVALIAWAMGDEVTFREAVADYVASCSSPEVPQDLVLGRAGILTGCAVLLDLVGPRTNDDSLSSTVKGLQGLAHAQLWSAWDMFGVDSLSYLGVSHGTAGACYAGLLWSEVSGDPVPAGLQLALARLEELAEEQGPGLRWPIRLEGAAHGCAQYMESWCHGSPGYVFLWTTAARVLGETRYLEFAERAAWTAWTASRDIGSLCCGDAGRAYGLLALARHGGGREWVDRADKLARRARETCSRDGSTSLSLLKGRLGVSLLACDLQEPGRSAFPLFEKERRARG